MGHTRWRLFLKHGTESRSYATDLPSIHRSTAVWFRPGRGRNFETALEIGDCPNLDSRLSHRRLTWSAPVHTRTLPLPCFCHQILVKLDRRSRSHPWTQRQTDL